MFPLTDDQRLFEATTAQFLTTHHPPESIRGLRERASVFDQAEWSQGAELGWTSLLVDEADGGGSINGNGMVDLLIVAYHFGRTAAPGPLLVTNVVAYALGRWGTPEQRVSPLAELLTGSGCATWACAADVRVTQSGDDVVLDGVVPCAEAVAESAHLLVSGYLVPRPSPGVELTPLEGIDLGRRFHRVTLREVRVPASAAVGDEELDSALLDVMAVLQAGEIAGAAARAFEMTLQWTFDRYSFGRPLASYQEIKHRIADLRMHVEACEAIAARAARAVGERAADAASWAAAAKAYTSRHGPEVIQDCIQLHGGIGVTFEHDLHLFLRRAATDAQLYGTPEAAYRRVAQLVAAAGATP
jgi:alkylation response protein AidB-like acyl-CoA dehydrogenase